MSRHGNDADRAERIRTTEAAWDRADAKYTLAVERENAPVAWEFQWTLADVVTALCDAGLVIERLQEHPEQFWPLLREIPEAEMRRLPHSFSVLEKAKAA